MMMTQHTMTDPTWLVLHGTPDAVVDAPCCAAIFAALDDLHDRVSAAGVLPLASAELVGWLEDISYTAQQIVIELRANLPQRDNPETGVMNAQRSACN